MEVHPYILYTTARKAEPGIIFRQEWKARKHLHLYWLSISKGARTEVGGKGFEWDLADVLQLVEQYRSNKALYRKKM